MNFLRKKNGFATIPTILSLSLLVLIITTGIAASTFTETNTAVINKQSSQSLRYAESGARDALMRVARNKKYVCIAEDCYSLDIVAGGCLNNNGCAKISVSAGAGTAGDPKIIISKGIKENKTRKVEIRVVYDGSGHGEINNIIWQELDN